MTPSGGGAAPCRQMASSNGSAKEIPAGRSGSTGSTPAFSSCFRIVGAYLERAAPVGSLRVSTAILQVTYARGRRMWYACG